MKKKFLYILLFVLIAPYSFGSVSFIMKEHYTPAGSQVTVPVKVKDFLNIVSFQGTLQFDQTKLSYVSVQDFGLSGMNASGFGTTQTAGGILTFSWVDGAMAGVSLADSSTVFSVKFNVIGSNGQVAALSFINSPTTMEVINSAYNSIPYSLVNGAVHIQSTLPSGSVSFKLDSVSGTQGSQVSASLRSTGFTNIISAQGTIQFDPTKVTYAGIGYYGLPGMNSGNFGITQIASGKLTYSWFDATLTGQNMATGAPLFSVLFNLIGAAGTETTLSHVNTPTPVEVIDSLQQSLSTTTVNGRIAITGNTTQQTLRLKIDSIAGPNGSQVVVPVRAWHFKKVISMQGTISFNTAVATYAAVEQFGLPGLDATSFGTSQTGSGKLMFTWNDGTYAGQTLADSSILFAIRYNIVGTQGNITPLDFVNAPTPLEFIDTTFSAMSSVLQSGRIRVTGNASITAQNPSPLSYCAGGIINVIYSITGSFNAGNMFILQLSDASGSFASPTNLDTLVTTSGGLFTSTLPSGLPSGTLYRVRVNSTNPMLFGVANSSNITISSIPGTAATPTGATPICQGTVSGVYTTTGATAATSYQWNINPPAAGTTSSTTSSATINWSGTYSGSVNITVRGINFCGNGAYSAALTVNITATPAAPTGNAAQTFCNSATVANLAATGSNIQWYAASTGGAPLSTGTALVNGSHYYASQTVSGCESSNRLDVTVTINAPAAPTGAASQTFCNSATAANLAASGSNIQWYTTSTGGTPLSSGTALVNGNHYYATQTISGCQSLNRLDVTVTINTPAAPTGSASQTFCNSATIAALMASGSNIQWYVAASGGTPLSSGTALVNGNHYYASQSVNGCESINRLDVTVTINVPAAPTGSATQTFCNSATVANLSATGSGILWYPTSTGGGPLAAGTALVNGNHYYASQTISGCESVTRLDVTVTINVTPTPTGSASQTYCNGATVASLQAAGSNIQWYLTSTGGSALSSGTLLINGTHYYASQTISGCTGLTRLDVTVTITTTAAPTGSATQTFCNSATVANLTAAGSNIQWYATSTGGTALSAGTALVNGNHYYASQTANGCESSSRLDVTVTINAPAAPTGAASQSFCNSATVANLTASGSNIQWYTTSTGGTPLSSGTALVNGNHYYASQTVSSCESINRLDVTVTINVPLAPSGSATQTFCNSATVANLTASGSNILWYSAASGGTPLSSGTALVNGNHYYASQTIGGCESIIRLDVTVVINVTATPTGSATQTFCNSATIANLTATGSNILWYAAATGGTPLSSGTALVNGNHYYASQTVSGCESIGRLDVTVTINAIVAPTGSASQTFCNSATIANLTATGSNIQWYAASTGGTPLSSGTALVNGNHYYASQTVSGCESIPRLDVTVTINAPAAPTGSASQTFCNSATVANLSATGTNIQWYAASTGGAPLASGTALTNGTHYYATQTISGCESATRFDVTVTINVTPTPTGSASQTYCSGATVASLQATGSNIQWYAASTGGTPLASGTLLINGTHYYASQTINGCTSLNRLDVTVSITIIAAPIGSATQTFCNTATVANLSATGSNIQWYFAPTGGTPLASGTSLFNGNHYYATQTVGGCESSTRFDVTVVINAPAAPTGTTPQTFCNTATVANLTATGSNIQWYATSTGGTALASGTALANGAHYYASQTISGCESLPRLDVTVTINAPAAPTGNATQTFCNSATVANLSATGSNIQWYAASTGGVPLASGTALVSGTHYYASQTINGCESLLRFDVTVTINVTATPTGNATQTYCSGATVAALQATGNNIQWYATSTGGSPLPASTVLVDGQHYFASQTINSCESLGRFDVTVTIFIPATPVVNVVNGCGQSTLSTNATGSLLWSPGGQATSPIIVTTAGVYSVTQTISGCTSAPGSGTAAPIAIPVVNLGNDTMICVNQSIVLNAGNAGATYLWSPGGETSQTIVVDSSDLNLGLNTVSVQVTQNGCTGSDAININLSACAGVEEYTDAIHISILPNPSDGLFTIQTQGLSGNCNIQVYNISGQKVYSRPIETSDIIPQSIDLRGRAKGLYFVKIITRDKEFTKKVMVE